MLGISVFFSSYLLPYFFRKISENLKIKMFGLNVRVVDVDILFIIGQFDKLRFSACIGSSRPCHDY